MSRCEYFTIYDFMDETPIEEKTLSKEEIEAAFIQLLLLLKSNGNPYMQESFIKQKKFQKYIPSFRKSGWLVSSGHKEEVAPTLLKFHTVEEVVQSIKEYIQSLYIRIENGETIHWYEDTWRTWNKFIPRRLAPTRDEHMKLLREIRFHVDMMEKELGIHLGWKHYKKDELSRGSKMNCFNHKAYKKHFIPFLKEQVLKIKSYDEMEKFVVQDFLMGRWDWWSDKHYKLPPRPVVERLSLSPLQIACLVEADETNVDEIIKKILLHTGKSFNGRIERTNITTTPTFTWEDFDKSLTADDLDYLLSDTLRVRSLSKSS